ncbi:MAG: glycosyltransferase family 2 protein [Chitinophagales bacterium]|nr:glycosyltransferase family 2 protein [Chitinophagales bacterium]
MKASPRVDVVVLNYNGRKFLDDCFQSLRQTDYSNFKVYLLDNGSTEDDAGYVRQHYPEVEVLRIEINQGFCAAYNIGFKLCNGKYFVCLNNDVKVKPDWLAPLVQLAESDERIAAVQPKLLYFFDERQFEYAGASGGMIDHYGFPFARGRMFTTMEEDTGQYDDSADIFWATGAALFLRKSAVEMIGGFDETIVYHMDEIDLCWRFHLIGYTCRVAPQSVVLHVGGGTIITDSFKKMYWNHRNSIYLMLKNFSFYHALTKTAVHVLFDYVAVAQSIVTLKFTRAKAVLAAHFWIVSHLPLILKNRSLVQAARKTKDEDILRMMFRKSIVVQYFLFKRKKYSQLS